MRLSVSPATPFSDASLPNHTKMFELVRMVTSMNDFVYTLSVNQSILSGTEVESIILYLENS
jgi:hypothetical protein